MTQSRLIKHIKSVNWYRQETGAVVYLVSVPTLAVLNHLRAGMDLVCYQTRNLLRMYYNEDYLFKRARRVFSKFLEDKNYLSTAHKIWLQKTGSIEHKIKRIKEIDIDQVSNQKLLALNKQVARLSWQFWNLPIFLDIFDANADWFLENYLSSKRKPTPLEIKLLIRPEQLSYYHQYQLAVLKIINYKKTKVSLDQALNEVANDFYFISCSYKSGSPLTVVDVRRDFNSLKKNSPRVVIRGFENYSQIIREQKQNIRYKYRLGKQERDIINFFAGLALWREQRKAMAQKISFAFEKFGQEIARRSKYPWQRINICPPDYMDKIPVSKKVVSYYEKLIKNNYLVLYNKEKRTIDFLSKKICSAAIKYLEPIDLDISELSGQIACMGKQRGRVKIVTNEDYFNKFKSGDILVTAMTRPEFMPLIKKAKAIVTDEGGIGCHAAIVSRELNKPCIIGTRQATRVLKDGDLVEVDADQGIIKKLK